MKLVRLSLAYAYLKALQSFSKASPDLHNHIMPQCSGREQVVVRGSGRKELDSKRDEKHGQ